MPDLFSLPDSEQNLIEKSRKLLEADTDKSEHEIQILIDELRTIIGKHDQLYYKKSRSIISDQEYDALFAKLKELEEQHPQFYSIDSPTQKVNDLLQKDFATVKHLKPLYSLDNSYNLEDLNDFDRRVREGLPPQAKVEYGVELKYDGSSIAVIYENDQLVRAATRGNGVEGDDITENARVIKHIPKQALFSKFGIHKIELRGEVIISIPDFEVLNEERVKQNEILKAEGKKELELFKNPRNTSSGSVRLKDVQEVKNRRLQAIIYNVGYVENKAGEDITTQVCTTQVGYLNMLHDLGFQSGIENYRLLKEVKDISAYCLEWQEKRDTFSIEIDGMVLKVNELEYQKILGNTAHHPKWAIAYKFKARQAYSRLLKVDFQVGRTGAVTPVAKIEPVPLMGVQISSISLHNEDFIRDKDIRIGDIVVVERAGDVIPYIEGRLEEKRTGTETEIAFPSLCPSCEHHLVKPEGESVWRCINPDCPAQIEERLIHFVSIDAMNIQGLGQEIIRTFLKQGILKSILDIYQLDFDKVLELEGFKAKSVRNLQKSIEDSKKSESWRLMVGLGIRHVGITTAKMLVKQVEKLNDFKDWNIERYQQLNDIGPKVALSLNEFFGDKQNIELIEKLAALGVNIQSEEIHQESNKFGGKTFLFTGTMPTMSRDEGKILVEKNGGKVLSGVSVNLDYLIVGDKAGSKLSKAQKIPSIQILDENEFLKLLS